MRNKQSETAAALYISNVCLYIQVTEVYDLLPAERRLAVVWPTKRGGATPARHATSLRTII